MSRLDRLILTMAAAASLAVLYGVVEAQRHPLPVRGLPAMQRVWFEHVN